MAKTQHGRDLTGEEMAQMLEEFSNGLPKRIVEAFVQQVTQRTHPTLQQKMMGLFVAVIEKWSEETDFDQRNEATIKLAKKMVAATGDKYSRYLPTI